MKLGAEPQQKTESREGFRLIAKGDRAGAGQLFAKIAADPKVPQSIRARAVQIAGSLGVDATASLPGMPGSPPAQ